METLWHNFRTSDKNPKGSVLGKHLVTPTFLLTAHTVTTLNVEQMSKQMCRNKYDIAIVPLPKALANYQLVFFGGGSSVHLFWGCWDFFFASKSNIKNFRSIRSLTLSLWKCILYSLGQEFLHESHPVHSRDLDLCKITARLLSFNRINTIYYWNLAQSSSVRTRFVLGTGWSWHLKHALLTHINSCTKLLRSDPWNGAFHLF